MTLFCRLFLFGSCFLPIFGVWEIPRLTLKQESAQVIYNKNITNTVFFYKNETDSLYVGGINYVLELRDGELKNYTLTTCPETCENVVTVIEEFQNSILVCGTNGGLPMCWNLDNTENNQPRALGNNTEYSGFSPFTYSQNSLSLVVDGDLYTAAPFFKDGSLLQFRRRAGKQTQVWMYEPWITEPTFISAFVAKRYDEPTNEKIYVLFREKNSDSSPEADPWISRVGRICKVDKGGSKNYLQNIWTSFLKARLVCTIPGEPLYFNRLQDVYVQHSENWRDSRLYALFSSSWNSTAVCIYSLFDLDEVFEKSNFKGYNEEIPKLRPGTCVNDSTSLPAQKMQIIKNHPEMTDWIYPVQKHGPFIISNKNYTKITVDRVQAADDEMYNVVLLATATILLRFGSAFWKWVHPFNIPPTVLEGSGVNLMTQSVVWLQNRTRHCGIHHLRDNGLIHKILEIDFKAFIISETSLCKGSAPVQSMKLNSQQRKLFVGYPGQMSVLDLAKCEDYNASCQDCVLARDPYCAWTENGCTSQIKGGIQNISSGDPRICALNPVLRRIKRQIPSETLLQPIKLTVPESLPFYLTCPMESHHAIYSWIHNGISQPCLKTQFDCLYLIPAVSEHHYGIYNCISIEQNYEKVVKVYNVQDSFKQRSLNSALKLTAQKECILVVFAVIFNVF